MKLIFNCLAVNLLVLMVVYSNSSFKEIDKYDHLALVYHVRMPTAWDESINMRDVRERDKSKVRGVLAVCTWQTEEEDVKNNLKPDGRFRHLMKFADKHQLAVITWVNFKGYSTGLSTDDMSDAQRARYESEYNQRVDAWERGFKRLCRKYNLPDRNVLIYGISGGGQMAHRIALRKPEYFSAIHIHVNSSFDSLSNEGKNILWLVTTGELEYGYKAAQRFYKQGVERGYHMIFKAGENLGHSDRADIRELSLAFFEYAMNFVPDETNPEWKKPPVDKYYFMKHPTHIGDYLNHIVFPVNKAEGNIDPALMVSLPTKDIAEAWGPIWE